MRILKKLTQVKEPGHARVLLRRGPRLHHQGVAKRRPTSHSLSVTKQDHCLYHKSWGIISKTCRPRPGLACCLLP